MPIGNNCALVNRIAVEKELWEMEMLYTNIGNYNCKKI